MVQVVQVNSLLCKEDVVCLGSSHLHFFIPKSGLQPLDARLANDRYAGRREMLLQVGTDGADLVVIVLTPSPLERVWLPHRLQTLRRAAHIIDSLS